MYTPKLTPPTATHVLPGVRAHVHTRHKTRTAWHGTTRHDTTQHDTARHGTARPGTARHWPVGMGWFETAGMDIRRCCSSSTCAADCSGPGTMMTISVAH